MPDEFVFVTSSGADDLEDKVKKLLLGRKVVSVENIDDTIAELTLDNGTILRTESAAGITNCAEGWCFLETLCACNDVITDVKYEVAGDDNIVEYRLFVFSGDDKTLMLEYHGYESGYFGTGFDIKVKHCKGAA